MQERRTTVRVAHPRRAQYCAAGDPLPKDGLLTNVSERGAEVRLRQAPRMGERVTVNFPLTGTGDTITATGSVRWSGRPSGRRSWYPVGLEWLPLEEPTAHLLHQFLSGSTRAGTPRPAAQALQAPRDPAAPRLAWRWGFAGALLAAALCGGALLALQQRNGRLAAALDARTAGLEQLTAQRDVLAGELDATLAHLQEVSAEVSRLQTHAEALEGGAQQLRQEITQFQASYAELERQRGGLIDHILELEQERAGLLRRSVPLEALQRIVRETIADREAARRASLFAPRVFVHEPQVGDPSTRP